MARTVTGGDRPGFAHALRETVDGLRELLNCELALFKAETAESVRRAITGLVVVVVGAVFAIIALSVAVEAIVEWLAVVLESEALAAALVAVVTAIIAVIAIIYGAKQISSISPMPKRTMHSVKRDAEVISESVS